MPRTTDPIGTVRIRDVAPAPDAPPDAPAVVRRRISGLAVPYGVIYRGARDVGPGAERFALGAFRASAAAWMARQDGARLPILDRHSGEVVGTADELADTPAGLRFAGELLDTPAASAYATRVRAGVNGISIEFEPGRTRRMSSPPGVEHVDPTLLAIAGSHAPAYDGARAVMRSRDNRGGSTVPTVTADYIGTLTDRIAMHRERAEALTTIAQAETRELTDEELTELDAIDASIRRLEPTLLRAREERARRSSETAAAAGATSGSVASERGASGSHSTERRSIYSGPGAYLRDVAAARHGDTSAVGRIERALADETTTNMAGFIPSAITGPVIGGFSRLRPLVDSFTAIPIGADGMSIIRPTITGGDVDVQATEKTEVKSTVMTAAGITTALKTYAGGVDVSWQLIERSSPAALDALFRRLGNRYARRTEIVAAASFATAVATGPAAIVTTAGLTAAKALAAIIGAATAVASTDDVDQFPDTIWLSLASWATLAGLTDTTGRVFFGGDGVVVGLGANDQVRLRPVIVPRLAGASVIVGSREYVESYELPGSPVQFRTIEAALLGTNISVAGLFALAVTNPAAFQRITLTA